MLNEKKFEMAFKKYKKNWVGGIKFEDVEKRYEESKSRVNDIVELNAVDKDHILLIRLSRIASYYISKWKNDVLTNGGNSIEELKKVHMVVFYQCMGHDLYRTRYPNMDLEYDFLEVITTLIHYTMFGWEREENILFNFIMENLDSNILDVNYSKKHTWFLLELYLQYRSKTIFGKNQRVHIVVREKLKEVGRPFESIPEDLDIYREALELWSTPDLEKIQNVITKMSLYHSTLATEIGQAPEFGDFIYAFYPFEILLLIHVRKKMGLPVPEQFDDLLMNTPEAKVVINDPEPYPEWDPLLSLIDEFYRKNYPNYIPNKHGELFK